VRSLPERDDRLGVGRGIGDELDRVRALERLQETPTRLGLGCRNDRDA
jgi:hypothetical protein